MCRDYFQRLLKLSTLLLNDDCIPHRRKHRMLHEASTLRLIFEFSSYCRLYALFFAFFASFAFCVPLFVKKFASFVPNRLCALDKQHLHRVQRTVDVTRSLLCFLRVRS